MPDKRAQRLKPFAAFAAGLLIAALACNYPGGPKTVASSGNLVVREVAGEVTVRQVTDGPEMPATVDQLLPAGAQVSTKGGGQAKLGLPQEGEFVRLGEDATLTVLELSELDAGPRARLGLLQGKAWVVLSGQGGEATVETPGGSATGNGQMSVEYYANFAGTGAPLFLVTCPVGVCSVSNPFGGVALTPGQQTEVAGSNVGPSEPHPMDPDQQADWEENVPEVSGGDGATTGTPTATVDAAAPPATTTTPQPGVTPPTGTPTGTPSATPSATPLGPPCVVIATDANVRAGPNTVFDVYGVALTGEVYEVVGIDPARTWYVIVFAKSPTGRGWIWGNLVTLCGDHSNVQVVVPPPTPTYTPTATFTPTYTFTPTNTNTPPRVLTGTATATGTFSAIIAYVQPSIHADPNPVTIGCDLTNTNIIWSAPGASSATLNGQSVSVPDGNMNVCVLQDTTYTLIATYPDKSKRQASVDVDLQVVAHAP